MKKLIQILVLGALLGGCSGLPNISLPQLVATATQPAPVDTLTPAASSTPIPTQNLFATATSTPLTFTPTVTSIGAELFTPTNTATAFPTSAPTLSLPTPGLPPDASSGGIFTPQSVGFMGVLLSSNTMYWNEGPCDPRNIKFSAFVADPVNTDKVFLFTRLREKKNTLNVTRWNAGALMIKDESNGSFNYNIRTFNLRRYYYFREAWLEYQLVALNEDQEEIGRTPIYNRNAALVRCQPVQ
ncbi:MAG TPA: hypothetical protein VFM05_15320 [Candidatus Saccharimonadales bacterium]|nr:hypothetical protein [Candidatus Saccharimonadales bacterium]